MVLGTGSWFQCLSHWPAWGYVIWDQASYRDPQIIVPFLR